MSDHSRLKIAVVGTGISGLSAAWLLAQRHNVTIYEQSHRLGGHSNTVIAQVGATSIPVDTGFIVFNRKTYPNLTALFEHLGVATEKSDMSFAASLDGGTFEYMGGTLQGLFAQMRNISRPRFWRMLSGVLRFYRKAVADAAAPDFERLTLGEYLEAEGYGEEFTNDHLLPMASAIWSAAPAQMLTYPALSFIRFHANHGLLQLMGRPDWETVSGGSINYVKRLVGTHARRIHLNTAVLRVERDGEGVTVADSQGRRERFDQIVLACHSDQALNMLAQPTEAERNLLGAIRYQQNLAVLHSDPDFMPKRQKAWASWNYVSGRANSRPFFTYWMNRLQNIPHATPLFVTLNPPRPPRPELLHHSEIYDHPLFDRAAIAAQRDLWTLQGVRRAWFCGAYFGAGFHEDGLQAGLAVGEDLGGVRRPWCVPDDSGRIVRLPLAEKLRLAG